MRFEGDECFLLTDFIQDETLRAALLLPFAFALSSSGSTTPPWKTPLPFSAARTLDLARKPLVTISKSGKAAAVKGIQSRKDGIECGVRDKEYGFFARILEDLCLSFLGLRLLDREVVRM